MSEIFTVGVSYRTAPLDLRELIAVSADGAAERLRQLVRHCRLPEAAILSTCNRTEIYCLSESPAAVVDWLARAGRGDIGGHIYQQQGVDAVRHLFRVASGLDSQMLGEPEIAGQVKQFARLAQQAGCSGTIINRLMEHSLAAAKAVRAQTEIGRHSLSYPALAAKAATGIFPDLRQVSVLFVGAGDMALAGAPVFADRGVRQIAVAGRDGEKTGRVAARLSAAALPISRLPEVLADFDVVVSATNSQVPIIGKGAVESALRRRQHRPMMFADLALPRDLEPEIQQLPDVFVYHLDQFGAMAAENDEKRQRAAQQGEKIVDEHARSFCRWVKERGAAPRVRDFRRSAHLICEEEKAAALEELAAGAAPGRVVEELAHRLAGRLMHAPTQCTKRGGDCRLHEFVSAEESITLEPPPGDDPGAAAKAE